MTATDATAAAGVLLATKLHAPRRRREVVGRPRLTNKMVTGQPALTLVSAPAGFGKTTLLTEWLDRARAANRSVAWLALDSGDNDPAASAPT
jgi:LuxR family maltose regulon positive regulatory protein